MIRSWVCSLGLIWGFIVLEVQFAEFDGVVNPHFQLGELLLQAVGPTALRAPYLGCQIAARLSTLTVTTLRAGSVAREPNIAIYDKQGQADEAAIWQCSYSGSMFGGARP